MPKKELTTWNELIKEAFKNTGDNFEKMVSTMTMDELNIEFDDGYGSPNGIPFTAWGENYVYFPVCYDGAESVGFAPRNPCDIKTEHLGGW